MKNKALSDVTAGMLRHRSGNILFHLDRDKYNS